MKRFFNLKFGDKFDLADGETYQKETWNSAVRSYGPRIRVKLWPMSKVLPIASELTKMIRRDGVRLAKAVVTALTKSSPFVDLLTGGKFPGGISSPPPLGERVRNMRLEHGSLQPHKDDERTGPSC